MSDQTTQPEQTQEPVQLKIADLLVAAQVIQLASARGAIRAEEMEQVGAVYNRMLQFLQASGALTPANASTETPAEQPAQDTGAELPAA